MKYAVLFFMMAGMAAYGGAMAESAAARAILSWIAASFVLVGTSYARARPVLLFKRSDGRRPWWAWLVLWPYFVLVWMTWWMYCVTDRRAASTQIAPGVWLSRRLTAREASMSGVGWKSVLDLAVEFPRTNVAHAAYCSLGALDGTPPTIGQLRAGVAWINAHKEDGPVLVHCALGHGRSASVIIAWLLAQDETLSVMETVTRVRAARPGVGLKPSQMARLEEFRIAGTIEPPIRKQDAEDEK